MNIVNKYLSIREKSLEICQNLEVEDFVVQPIEFVSPPKWHLAHTTWFFEEMILKKFKNNYKEFSSEFSLLFNSYYKSLGKHWLQGDRGQLSRPTVKTVFQYREHVNEEIVSLLNSTLDKEVVDLINIGIHHEKQHQELLLMDIKYILGMNPSKPRLFKGNIKSIPSKLSNWLNFNHDIYEFGTSGEDFSYDNEGPRHKVYLNDFSINSHLISNGEYLEFMQDDGYKRSELWLSKGYNWISENNINSPLYWRYADSTWLEYTLYGEKEIDSNLPVTHISYHEAYAFAKWKECRLPSEYELELFFRTQDFKDSKEDFFHPYSLSDKTFQGWNWTTSQYNAYPGYKELEGSLGEYNGKFMCDQFVLRGGCVVTPKQHLRHTYRNFYEANQRWMYSTIRLAKDIL